MQLLSAYMQHLSTLPTTKTMCFVLRIAKTDQIAYLFYLRSYDKQNEAKLHALSWPLLPPRTPALHRASVSEASSDHYGLGLTKPATFLRLRFPGHERACSRIHETSLVLRTTIL